jgi:N-formylglutamate amidohydrolase
VWLAPEVSAYQPGVQYLGRQAYVEYVPGTLPVVISAPHGGALEPDEIPDRSYGTVVTDAYTAETLLAVREAFVERTGEAPHVVISHLRRTKLDPNREIVEAAQGNPFAENAWEEFQGFIDIASDQVETDFGAGLYLDLHGHGHPVHRVEVGYLLSASNLNMADGSLDSGPYAAASSVASLAARSPLRFSRILRGETSFGGFLQDAGVRSVPSPGDPSPGQESYFSGGYNTHRHGSREGGRVDGIQLELHRVGLRDSDSNRRTFGRALAATVEDFMLEHYGFFQGGG